MSVCVELQKMIPQVPTSRVSPAPTLRRACYVSPIHRSNLSNHFRRAPPKIYATEPKKSQSWVHQPCFVLVALSSPGKWRHRGIEPGAIGQWLHEWQPIILPLNHWCSRFVDGQNLKHKYVALHIPFFGRSSAEFSGSHQPRKLKWSSSTTKNKVEYLNHGTLLYTSANLLDQADHGTELCLPKIRDRGPDLGISTYTTNRWLTTNLQGWDQ